MRTDSQKKEILKGYLETLCKCYSSGRFENLFPLLADDCVFESQWVLTPNTGKAAVVDYFIGKGATLRKNNCCPTCTIVEFVGSLNTIKNAEVHLNGGETQRASFGLLYPEGKLAMLMCQTLKDVTNGVIVDLQLDENDCISRIDLCMPELFNFKHFAGPFEIEGEEDLDDQTIEAEIKRMLDEAEDDFSELDDFISSYEDSYSGDIADFAFRAAIQSGKTEYVDEHADDFDLNDGDGYSTYLYETDDEEMQEILMNHGAFKSWDDYEDCRFAMETVNGEILAFDSDFQQEVFKKYKETYELSDERIAEIISDGIYDDASGRDVEDDLATMGVSINDDEYTFEDKCGDGGYELMELLEDLGWDCSFEGDSWKLETIGVYFIK